MRPTGRSVLLDSRSFRWLVTVLTAVCVPLCCCTLQAFRACDSCQGGECHAAPARHDCCHDEDAATLADHGHSAPDHRERHDAPPIDRGCKCGGDHRIATLGKVQSPVPPLTFVYIVPSLALPTWDYGTLPAIGVDSRAPLLPARTLLRLHCALIV